MFEELESVLRYISQEIEKFELAKLYEQLAQLYEQARTSPSPEITQNITEIKDKIRQAQEEIQPKDWDVIRLRIFEKFGAGSVLGTLGYASFEQQISQFANDPSGTSQTIQKLSSEIGNLKQRSEQALNSLEPLFKNGDDVPENKQKVQLVFEDLVAIEKMDSLEHQAHEWDIILKNFKFLPTWGDDAKLWKIYKSSPTVIVIVAPVEIILAIGAVTYVALQIVEKLYSIRELKLKIKHTELENEQAEKMLQIADDSEQKKLNQLIEEKIIEVMTKYKPKLSETEGNLAEAAIRYNIKKIYNFTVQGGKVNVVDGEQNKEEGAPSQSQLQSTYEKIKKINQGNNDTLQLASFSSDEEEQIKNGLKKVEKIGSSHKAAKQTDNKKKEK